MEQKEKDFLTALAALLKRHGFSIEKRTSDLDGSYFVDWSFEGEGAEIDIEDAKDWIEEEANQESRVLPRGAIDGPPRFTPARVIVSSLVRRDLTEQEINEVLERHYRLDGGPSLLPKEMVERFEKGEELFSAFEILSPGELDVYVRTEPDRSVTRVFSRFDDEGW